MRNLELTFEAGAHGLQVRHFSVEEGLCEPFSLEIVARSPQDDLDFEAFVGKDASFEVYAGGNQRRWSGLCRSITLTRTESDGLSSYEIVIVSPLWLLTQRVNHRLFQHQSAVEIALTLLGEWSIEPRLDLAPEAFPKLELRCQYGESDYAFLCRILEEAGISHFYPPVGSGPSKLVLADAPQTAESVHALAFLDQAEGASSPYATRVRLRREVRPGKVTLRDHDLRRHSAFDLSAEATVETGGIEDRLEQHVFSPGAFVIEMAPDGAKAQDSVTGVASLLQSAMSLAAGAPQGLEGAAASLSTKGAGLVGGLLESIAADSAGTMAQALATAVATPAPGGDGSRLTSDDQGFARADETQGRNLARMAAEALTARRYEVALETNVYGLGPGSITKIIGHPQTRLAADRRILIARSRFEGTHDGEWTHALAGHFADVPFRPALKTPKPKISGAQSAIVVGPPGAEIYTDEFGRVRVHFHWDRENPRDATSSCWLRLALGWSGPGYGLVTLPRVGQEVLVTFLEGDPDQPVVTGTLFGNTIRHAHRLPGHKTRSSFRSSSSPGGAGGNEMMFEDALGRELVYLHAERDMQEIVRSDRASIVGEVSSMLAGEKHRLAIAQPADPEPTIEATSVELIDRKITLTTGEASIVLEGPNITIQAQGLIVVKSDGDDVIIRGGPMVKINTEDPHAPKPGGASKSSKGCDWVKGNGAFVDPPISKKELDAPDPSYSSVREGTYLFPGDSKPTPATIRTMDLNGRPVQIISSQAPPSLKGATLPQHQDVASSLAQLPPHQTGSIHHVVLSPNPNPRDPEWAVEYKKPNFQSFATAGGGVMTFYPTHGSKSKAKLKGYVEHESGHLVSEQMWRTPGAKEAWMNAVARDGKPPSEYATSSEMEDFAETMVIYNGAKGTPCEAVARKNYPARYALLDEYFGESGGKGGTP